MSPSRHPVLSVVYSSTATSAFTDADLAALLTVSRRNNARAGLTGMLVTRQDRFLQVLEGPEPQVEELMTKIVADTGHHNVRVLLREPVENRQFADWTMRFAQLGSADARRVPGYDHAFNDLADESNDVNATTAAVRELVRWFEATSTPTM
jgi:hypothetical protein